MISLLLILLVILIIGVAPGIHYIKLGIDGITKHEISDSWRAAFSTPSRYTGRDATRMGYFFLFLGIFFIGISFLLYNILTNLY